MSPEDKRRLVVISGAVFSLFLLLLVLSYIPGYLYVLLISVASGAVYFHKAEELQLFERLGLNPRRGLSIPPALLRWLPGRTLSGVPAAGRNKIRKSDARHFFASPSDRHFAGSYYRRDQTLSDSVFSPRDILMGSYLVKPEESPSAAARAAGGSGNFINPREQLRERLARPNHAAHTPNRRLSFGEPMGTVNRFTITPHRHYPLQQTGTSPVGVMPPAKWDELRKKSILTQRNSPAVHSPVTVKIARPDSSRSSFFNHLNSPGAVTSPGIGAQADPCSRETVLSVLRESRKREVDEGDKCASGQKSKRRRNDSDGSSHSAFEPHLANGAPSQLVPKPGSLKRGIMNSSVLEESTMKRSRTSSISSVAGGPVPSGVPGSVRNPIRSSYSSSQGYSQRRAASSLSLSPFTSPGGSRCQTPERVFKKAREDDAGSPGSTSFLKTDKETSDPAPSTAKLTPKSEAPVVTASDSGGSGKRKRKIQLVTTNRGDQISLPPPPELGYTITVKDLDMEKKAALTQIQKVLEEPEPESSTPASEHAPALSLSLFSIPSSTSSSESAPAEMSAPSLLSLSKPVPEMTPATTAALATTIDLTVTTPSAVSTVPLILTSGPSFTSTPAAPTSSISNPLLESLKNMKNNPLLNSSSLLGTTATTAVPAVSVVSLSTPAASTDARSGVIKSESGSTVLQSLLSTPSSISTLASKPATSMPSAFAQILAQPLQPSPSISPSLGGGGGGGSSLFSLIKPVATSASHPPASTPAPLTAAVCPTISTNSISNQLSSGFKPIFGAASTTPASTAEVKPTQPIFKPLFGSTTQSSAVFGQTVTSTMSTPAALATQPSSMLFGGLTSSQPPAVPASSAAAPTQAPSQTLFGGWNATTTSAPTAKANFQFGAAATTTAAPALNTTTASASATTSAFQFGAVKPAPAPQTQSTFAFGQLSANQNSTSTPFGGFGMATTTTAAPTTQTTFGSSTFTASASPFPGTTQPTPAAPKTFAFGGISGSSAKPGATSFAFGAAASTAAPTFGTYSQPTFGGASSGFSFGNTTTPSAAPVFGATTQTAAPLPAPAPTFGFGATSTGLRNPAPSTPAPPSGGFNFGAQILGTPFGTPAPATQTPGFSFGANNTDNKPAFGTSTPAFGQGSTGMSMPFGSPGTPGFGAVGASPFGASPASFSIGTGSKPSGQRRLQARRQQRKK